ncbi:ketopantoate reductase family protein [Celeribacter neptunius]|uniref:2-dehydropantoate 2-reductase n=1 Tax=Celeribacter neptunius TaxID=588602 RepID=A0A1I3NJT3_9RHOB|nr:2-dehydropantoate 2-reductase N-terminal domain-containing protein [Celeribacter neptunius]SFJ09638.1 2-dehydropantoate 2-reductase [Celeribacter neptunius]
MSFEDLKIGIIGAGNIGTALAALLSRSGAEVCLVARGARLEAVREAGVKLDDRGDVIEARIAACEILERPVDALFICVKAQGLAAAVATNKAAIGPETLVIPLANGMPFWFYAKPGEIGHLPYLDPRGELAAILSPAQILGAVMLMTVRMDDHGRAISSNTPTLGLGPICDGGNEAALSRLIACLEAGGVRSELSADVREKVLVKLIANLATNPLTALTGATLREVGETAELREIATALADEFRLWAGTQGYALPSNDWLVDLFIDAGDFPTSMLQDARAGRPLELDAICRAPLEMARREGGDMPLLARLIDELDRATELPVPPEAVSKALARLQTVRMAGA